jgi:hypothetical protein
MNRAGRRVNRMGEGAVPDRRARRHLAWIDQQLAGITAVAAAGYAARGRGAVYADLDAARGGYVALTYLGDGDVGRTPALALAAGTVHGWPDDTIAGMVRTYDPAAHVLVLITHRGRQSAYRVRHAAAPPGRGCTGTTGEGKEQTAAREGVRRRGWRPVARRAAAPLPACG